MTEPFRDELAAAHQRIAELESLQSTRDTSSDRETRVVVARLAVSLDEAAQRYRLDTRWFALHVLAAAAVPTLFLMAYGGGLLGGAALPAAFFFTFFVVLQTLVFAPRFVRKCRAMSDSLRELAGDRALPRVHLRPFQALTGVDASIAPAERQRVASSSPRAPLITDREDSPSEDRARRGT